LRAVPGFRFDRIGEQVVRKLERTIGGVVYDPSAAIDIADHAKAIALAHHAAKPQLFADWRGPWARRYLLGEEGQPIAVGFVATVLAHAANACGLTPFIPRTNSPREFWHWARMAPRSNAGDEPCLYFERQGGAVLHVGIAFSDENGVVAIEATQSPDEGRALIRRTGKPERAACYSIRGLFA
jgi:hypothetical protein